LQFRHAVPDLNICTFYSLSGGRIWSVIDYEMELKDSEFNRLKIAVPPDVTK